MILFLVPATVAVFGRPDLVKSAGATYAVPIYVFAFIDAILTTREANAGRDLLPNGNPRIAATLNLLTNGLGYIYLGERAIGLVVFIGAQLSRRLIPGYLSILLQVGLAIHAWIKCRAMYPREPPSTITVPE